MPARCALLAVRDPHAARQPGLVKAIQVAQALGASLELFHALTDTPPIARSLGEYEAVDVLRERIEGQARISLVRLGKIAARHGVRAEISVEWDRRPHEAIVRRASKVGAELIIAECHQGVRKSHWHVRLADWELLRASPVPVLLLKNGRPYHRPLLLAAVDPAHAHAKPAALDNRILAAASELGKGLRGTLHVMHASYPSIVGLSPEPAMSRAVSSWSTLSYAQLLEQESGAFEEFREAAKVPRTRAHLVEGNPVAEIPRLARDLNAHIVAMGALSRSGLARLLIGNTAERVLNALPCDVLVVRPGKGPATEPRKNGRRVSVPVAGAPPPTPVS
jgi:universal stress protein E